MSEPEPDDLEDAAEDAIALFRPRNKAMILPFLDLDDGENADGIYAEELPDGAFLVHTFQPFELFDDDPQEARNWLAQFGIALPEVHDDARGFLFFPDGAEPDDPQSYDDVVNAIGDQGVWVGLGEVVEDDDDDLEPGEQAAIDLQGLMGALAGGPGGMDPAMLEKLGQLMGGAPGGPQPGGSFEIGQMFEQVQRTLLDAMTAQAQAPDGEPGEVIDDEFAPEPDEKK